jgi:hypothetical protein
VYLQPSIQAHLVNAPAIIKAILGSQANAGKVCPASGADVMRLPGLKHYQRYLLHRFGEVINKPSFDYISKTRESWLLVGDRRREIAGDILLIIERYGLGVGMLVLHLQQIRAGHILTHVRMGDQEQSLATPTEFLSGAQDELVLFIPIRQFRADLDRLASMNIVKPRNIWNEDHIVTHERDKNPCFYCTCVEINPAEVVVDLDGQRHGLSRHYSVGFTFAPFGNPLAVVHFLAWDRARHPLNMNRVPMTVSDLVKLTHELNLSIRSFFAETPVRDFPVLDGISNGWAGNTIFHQHFQFFAPEHTVPITRADLLSTKPLVSRDDVAVDRLKWSAPVCRIRAADALTTGLVGNDLAGIWRLLGGSRKVPYKSFHNGYLPDEKDKIHVHTQNLYVPGQHLGNTAYLVLRDRERVDFRPGPADFVNRAAGFKLQRKDNIGVLESTATFIVDDRKAFEEMKRWQPSDVSRQIRQMIAAISPVPRKIAEYEKAVRELFPM